ncbi:hypothetical protein Franean1_7237 [Parafrankia sp. EAN1pec]|uniref:hypothetical protein n=1 Tax=Parafrankia sp. (strain EAN1pec) TaxID=298653 RepID=UPI0000542C6F|nr:hypothetical protein Franean1_7237 [Frankia sp. EAN1pec]
MTDGAWRGDPRDPAGPGYRERPPGAPDDPGPDGYWDGPDQHQQYRNDPRGNGSHQGVPHYQGGPPAGYPDGPQPGGAYQQPGYPPAADPGRAYGSGPGGGPYPPAGPAGGQYSPPPPGPGARPPAGGGAPYPPGGPGPATGPYPPPGPATGGYPSADGPSGPASPGAPGGGGARRDSTSVRGALVPRAGAGRAPTRPPGSTGPAPRQAPERGSAVDAGAARPDLYQPEPSRAAARPGTDAGARRGGPDPAYRDAAYPQMAHRDVAVPDADPRDAGRRDVPYRDRERGYRDGPARDTPYRDPDGPADDDGRGPMPGTGPRARARAARRAGGQDGTGPQDRARSTGAGTEVLGAVGAASAGTGPRRAAPPRQGGFDEVDFPGEPDFPDDGDGLDGPDGGESAGLGPFLRRLVIALVVLGVALAVGVGAGVIWEKVRPSGDTATTANTPPTATPGTGPSASPAPSTGAPAGGGQPQAAVPADWVAFTDPDQKATFSHPPTWKQRRDNTGVFFGEPGAGAVGTPAEYGPQMIGVARVAGADAATALSQVQSSEFGSVSGLTQDRSGPATDTSGATVQELAGSYDRDGQRVSYLMRTSEAPGAVYVLIARVRADASASLNTMMGALRASFQPAA